MLHKKIFLKCFSFWMVLCIVIGLSFYERAEGKGTHTIIDSLGNQIVYDSNGDPMISIRQDGKYIKIEGDHAISTAQKSYRTVGYNITLEPTDGIVKDNLRVEIPLVSDAVDELKYDRVHTTYTIDTKEWTAAVRKTIKGANPKWTERQINQKLRSGVDIYMHNIFRLITRSGGSGSLDWKYVGEKSYHNLEGIIKAPIDIWGVNWSQSTKDYLPHYYDIKLSYQASAFYYNVVYVDVTEDEYSLEIIGTPKDDIIELPAFQGAYASCYNLEDEIEYQGEIYELAHSVQYSYGNAKKGEIHQFEGNKVEILHEKADHGYMAIGFRKKKTSGNVEIRLIEESSNQVIKKKQGGDVKNKKKYIYTELEDSITANGKTYTYQDKWNYSYFDESGKEKKINGAGKKIEFTLKDLKSNSKVFITLYYGEKADGPNGTITPIPPAGSEVLVESEVKYFDVDANAAIKADKIGKEYFDVLQGIPTTESVYGIVKAKEYLLDASFITRSGTIEYMIPVTQTYVLRWRVEEEENQKKNGNDSAREDQNRSSRTEESREIITRMVSIKRKYTYTEIKKIQYYQMKEAQLYNAVLPKGRLSLKPKGYSIPKLTYIHYEKKAEHLVEPKQVKEGIWLSEVIIEGSTQKPSIPSVDFQSIIEPMVDQILVRNDSLIFDNKKILDSTAKEQNAVSPRLDVIQKPELSKDNVLFQDFLMIDSKIENGEYPTTGTLCYQLVTHFNAEKQGEIEFPINSINPVIVHTPVYCNVQTASDNVKYVQLVEPDSDNIALVLDEKGVSSDFVITISNDGYHSAKPGYMHRDYSKSKRDPLVSYLALKDGVPRNEVFFPFDIYFDVDSDFKRENDILIPANTWYTIGKASCRFYLPMWVTEGRYTILCRSVAVNGEGREAAEQEHANTSILNYAAFNKIAVQISGKLYGLSLYDISDYPKWQSVFRIKDSLKLKKNNDLFISGVNSEKFSSNLIYDYKVGINNEYGEATKRLEQYTFPLVTGSHPAYSNIGIMKAGYTFRFSIDSIGSEMMENKSAVLIEPSFYYVDKNGQNRQKVNLYYTQAEKGSKKSLICIGSQMDLANCFRTKAGNVYLGIPEEELKVTAQIQNRQLQDWKSEIENMYSYGKVLTKAVFKTYSNMKYAKEELQSKNAGIMEELGLTETELTKRKQTYYFEYSLPPDVRAVSADIDVKSYAEKSGITYQEDFWKKDGYLIVNFNITAYDRLGKPYLSYINAKNYPDYCSMWLTEGASLQKTDRNGKKFQFKAGDTLLFYIDKTIYEDIKAGGIY